MCNVFVVVNHKGGVGKTTTSTNLGAALSRTGRKVLLIDLDPQASLSVGLGITKPLASTIYEALSAKTEKLPIVEITEKLHVVPSNLNLSAAEIELTSQLDREYVLAERLKPVVKDYQVIIIDAPPSIGLLTINALTAASQVIIPLQAQYLALQGITKLVEVINKMRVRINPSLEIGGVLLTQFDKRKILDRSVLEGVEKTFGTKVLETKIRTNVALAEAPSHGLDIFRYAPDSHGAEDYQALAQEIMRLYTL